MKPLHLEITGLRSFRAKQEVDFSDLSFFAVIGDTGAGKSSILEAIVFALYSASTWDARGGGVLMSLDADAMTVVFDFAVAGRRYRVSRTLFRNARPAVHALRSPDDPDYRFDGDQPVNAEIRRLVGLDYDTFRKTVVLPQGRFAELLNARETERLRVLGDLLGLDEIDRLREKLDPARQEADAQLRETRAARGALGDDPAAEAERFEEAERQARDAHEAMTAARDGLRAKIAEHLRVSRQAAALEIVRRESAEARAEARAVCGLVPEHERLQGELEALAGLCVHTRSDLEAAEAELRRLEQERRDVTSIVTFAADVRRLQSDHRNVVAEDAALEKRECDLNAESDALERAREALAELRTKAANAQRELAAAERHRDVMREREGNAQEAWRSCARAVTAHEDARLALADAEKNLLAARGRRAALAAAVDEADSAYDLARAAYERLEREHRAAALAHELHAGDPCPLCRRTLPDTFVAPVAPDVVAAKQARDRAERERDNARREDERAGMQLETLEANRERNEGALLDQSEELETARNALLETGIAASAANEGEALLPVRAEIANAIEAVGLAQEARDREKSAFDRSDAEVTSRGRALVRDRKTLEVAVRARDERKAHIERLRLTLPEAYRPSDSAKDQEIHRILEALALAKTYADDAADKQKSVAAQAQKNECLLRGLESEYRQTVADAAASRRNAIERSLALQDEALRCCELAVPPVCLGDGFGELAR